MSNETWRDYWSEKSKHLSETYLTADTHSIVQEYAQMRVNKALEDQKREIVAAIKDVVISEEALTGADLINFINNLK